jgi:hypothetical protein
MIFHGVSYVGPHRHPEQETGNSPTNSDGPKRGTHDT